MFIGHNSYYVNCLFLFCGVKIMLNSLIVKVMKNVIICQCVRCVSKSFISYMLDTRTNKRFYSVRRSDGITLDFKRIDSAERFAKGF